MTEVVLVGTKPRPQNAPGRRRPQLGRAGQLRVRRQPARRQRGRPYYGLYQFTASTWHGVGGVGRPDRRDAAAEQTYRAQILYNRSGAGQWPVCGQYLFT